MPNHEDLGLAIDAASDAGNEAALRQLCQECDSRLASATGEDRVFLLYYQSNTYATSISSQLDDPSSQWEWEQFDAIQNVLLLRRAISEPSFRKVDPIVRCQIRTNLAGRLNSLGRPVAANEQWLETLRVEPRFAKALANRAGGTAFYASRLYDQGHQICLLAAARAMFDAALHKDALWESDDRDQFTPGLVEQRNRIQTHLTTVGFDEHFDSSVFSLGATEAERSYRQWCLSECLFLNPLNEAYTDSVAATDVLHLPSHAYRAGEPPRFPPYYNLLKQEYVSARYRLYRATHEDDLDFIMRDVLMFDSGENQALGHYTDDLRAAFRSAYSIFDKVGLFLNDYFQIGLRPMDATFRRVWSQRPSRVSDYEIRPIFKGRRNWSLRGLYFLSKDLFDDGFEEVSEPDASDLARLRNRAEHRFLSFQRSSCVERTDSYEVISLADFEGKTLRLLKLAREALIYLSLAMYTEVSQDEASGADHHVRARLVPRQITLFRRSQRSS